MKKIILFLLLSTIIFAQTKEPLVLSILDEVALFIGSYGKLIAILGLIGILPIYLLTHNGAILLFGIIIPLMLGALIGVSGINDTNSLYMGYFLLVLNLVSFYNLILAVVLDDKFTLEIKKIKYI